MSDKVNKIFLVKQKNGRTVPITKSTKPCPVCGMDMFIERHKKGSVHKRAKMYWVCSETNFCKHRELEESSKDKYIRLGLLDESENI